jgi:CheY-like chemotaxis protein
MPDGGRLLIETQNVTVAEDSHHVHSFGAHGRYVLLKVMDSGGGMDAETMAHIFEPFFTTKEVGRGTGLGLATVYGIVKQHKGFIDVESSVGNGTAFRVYLPLGNGPAVQPEKPAVGSLRGGTECILIAEDNEDLREAARETLLSLGYRVIAAGDGEEAVRAFEAHAKEIDLVFVDVVLPRLNGPEVYLKMAALKPDISVIFTTGYASETNLIPIRTRENATILQKPYGSRYLAQKLREKLDQKK